ncbi:NAD(P)-binding protein [Elstera litoralis]|uniref:NAD(P)-binding protein n=1 Tax=Elstera litoralis TaxID=552518 RepID=UPI000A0117EC
MAHIPSVRSKVAEQITSHPYIDTPNFSYDQWLSFNNNYNRPLGSIPAGTRIAVIGAGVSGACASYELLRAGATVDLFDALDQVGGRADSVMFPGATSDLAELGAMRFPPSEFIMNWYLENFGNRPRGDCLAAALSRSRRRSNARFLQRDQQ